MAGDVGRRTRARPPDEIMALDGSNSVSAVLDRRCGSVLARYRAKGRYAGQMHWPHQLAIDRQGRVYDAEVGGSFRIQRFAPVTRPSR